MGSLERFQVDGRRGFRELKYGVKKTKNKSET